MHSPVTQWPFPVQLFPSLQEVPSGDGTNAHPATGSQTVTVQGISESSQGMDIPPSQNPLDEQTSFSVQTLPSSQGSPSFAWKRQYPFMQVSNVQELLSSQESSEQATAMSFESIGTKGERSMEPLLESTGRSGSSGCVQWMGRRNIERDKMRRFHMVTVHPVRRFLLAHTMFVLGRPQSRRMG